MDKSGRDRLDDFIWIVLNHVIGERQNQPANLGELTPLLPVSLERDTVGMRCPSISLDRDPLAG
jgi:hypothetical protein